MPPSFPLIPTSAAGDPFCTDAFCEDNSGNDANYYTSRYQYVRVSAVWTAVNNGVMYSWPVYTGVPVYTSDWFGTRGTSPVFGLEVSAITYLSPRPPSAVIGGSGDFPPWLINFTQRGALDAPPWCYSGEALNLIWFTDSGFPFPIDASTRPFSVCGTNKNFINPNDFIQSVAGKFQFTNGPLLSGGNSASAIVDWQGLPLPSSYIYH
jgi:hypothetical protein